MTTTTTTEIKIGQIGFGTVVGYPPTRWRLAAKMGAVMGVAGPVEGGWRLENVKHPSQSVAFPDQFVDWATVERLMRVPVS